MKPTPETISTPSSSEPAGPSLDVVAGNIRDVSTIPAVALRVMEVAADPESGAADLRAAVESDPALSARVLRCVNSAAFGLRTEIENLNQAVAYLGFNQIRDLAVTATVSTMFRSKERINHYDRAGLWRHMVATGVAARMIAARTKVEGFDNAFLSGLLHDLGIILFDQQLHDTFRQVMVSLNDSKTLVEFERKFVPWDHTELGERVAKSWKLPEIARVAMRHHHSPEQYSGPHQGMLHCVAVANVVCSVKDMSSVGISLVGLPRRSLEVLELSKSDLKIISEDLDRELVAHQHLFDMQKGS